MRDMCEYMLVKACIHMCVCVCAGSERVEVQKWLGTCRPAVKASMQSTNQSRNVVFSPQLLQSMYTTCA